MASIKSPGVLYLHLIGAKNTLAMDVNGLSDPYCKVFFESNDLVYRTQTIDKTLDPVWNEKVSLFSQFNSNKIEFEIWDKDMATAGAQDVKIFRQNVIFDQRADKTTFIDLLSDDFMGRYELAIDTNKHDLINVDAPLGPKKDKKEKPNKKPKNRGTFQLEYQYLPLDAIHNLFKNQFEDILQVIVTKTPHDGAALGLVTMFEDDLPRFKELMKLALTFEVQQTPSSEQLFRTDSMATKLMKASSKLLGARWLFASIYTTIDRICADNENIEVDPTKIAPGSSQEVNLMKLKETCRVLLEQIVDYFVRMPTAVHDLVVMIYDIVGEKFPESRIQAVSGYIFLRFFGPAISNPEAYGLEVQPQDDAKRHLLLAAKIIQTIANGASVREEFLLPLGDWIHEQHLFINQKLESMVSSTVDNPIPYSPSASHVPHYRELVMWLSSAQPVLERHGVDPQRFESLKTIISPYCNIFGVYQAPEEAKRHLHNHHNLTKAKSKK